jgi:serine/threonine protein phosphatase PrpC
MMPSTLMAYRYCALTDCGRVRANNEDAVITLPARGLALLADGMGGYNAGEVASSMAVNLVQESMSRWLEEAGTPVQTTDVRQALDTCVQDANLSILDASIHQPQYAGMGTTLVVAVFVGDRLVLGHIGDSRCYRLRRGNFQQITRDHSWLQEQMDAGLMTPQEAADSGARNLVTRALGVDAGMQMEFNEFQVEPQDLFLLCSDGLTDMLDDRELHLMVTAPMPLEEKARLLVDAANAMGGRDNISVVLVQAGSGPSKRGLISRWLR